MDKQESGQTQYPLKGFGKAEIFIFCIHAIWLIAILYYFYYKASSYSLNANSMIRIFFLMLIGVFAPTLIILLRTKYYKWALLKEKYSKHVILGLWIVIMLGLLLSK